MSWRSLISDLGDLGALGLRSISPDDRRDVGPADEIGLITHSLAEKAHFPHGIVYATVSMATLGLHLLECCGHRGHHVWPG